MSPPDTNIEKQERRHRPALWGIAIAVVIALVFVATRTVMTVENADEESQVETGSEMAPATETEGY
ncbi:hypothetical protein DZK27_13455 [Rhodobacteraceae bacterium 63075]|nr:hypothetical protein DZK27_13455 [Rhodobacteraceae bacterium 63075]